MEIIQGGVTAAKGFKAAGMNAGIKNKTKKDMAMIFSEKPCVTAGTFTTNKVFAAPVKWDKNIVYNSEYSQAVVINSGVANACTGEEGDNACLREAQAVSKALGIPENSVLVASTGVIGMQLPMDTMVAGINALPSMLADTQEAGTQAAEAIMTTDTRSKQVAVTVDIKGKKVTVGGMCKGAGMIHPNMATMLCFITSDVAINPEMLKKACKAVADETFNMISVDGDTSTNDMLTVLANGAACNATIESENEDYNRFYQALMMVCRALAKEMAADGEGATKLLECVVTGAPTAETAKKVAKSVICSNLLKAAMFGADANWGRVLCAIGYADEAFDIDRVGVSFHSWVGTIAVCANGAGIAFSEEKAKKILQEKEIQIQVDMGQGAFSATAWGCDLTYDYVKINGDYRT